MSNLPLSFDREGYILYLEVLFIFRREGQHFKVADGFPHNGISPTTQLILQNARGDLLSAPSNPVSYIFIK